MEVRTLLKPIQLYILFAFIMLSFMLVFVPKREIKKLFWFGLLWGSTLDFIVETLFSVLHLIKYLNIEPFNLGVLPLWTVLSWTPTNIVFIYFLPEQKKRYIFWLYILMYSGLTAAVGTILVQLRLLVFIHWSVVHWFILAVIFYYLMAKHYQLLEPKEMGSFE
ncbi:hypothetical protein [Hydrogenispora ethanolica]|uniref:hypothetical protein n=1 Tax=Hydrogenispora ethanolica TaxID=1082276 RepID=UPI00105107E1|nr:hypothetical protein [Hydrogenispora ethanolica]